MGPQRFEKRRYIQYSLTVANRWFFGCLCPDFFTRKSLVKLYTSFPRQNGARVDAMDHHFESTFVSQFFNLFSVKNLG